MQLVHIFYLAPNFMEMAKFNVLTCPACGGKEFEQFLTCTDYFVTGEEFSLKSCRACGLKITENIEDEDNIGRYYQSEEYISHSNTSKGIVNAVYHQVRQFMLKKKRVLAEKVTSLDKGQILDVGTGTGFFLNEMKQNGWQTTGTEKSSDARSFAKTEFGLDLLEPEAIFSIDDNSFDAVTLWHVLEHIHRLDENMKAFHRLLKPSGKLIIAVPNFSSYDARHYGKYWAAYDVPRHIWHFSPPQMKLFAGKYGFEVVKMKTMPFDSFYVSMLSEKYRKSGFPLFGGILHGKISWLNSIIRPQQCSSVIYVLAKKQQNSY